MKENTDKVAAAMKAVSTMMMYYYQALMETGCADPKQEIATQLPDMIKLTEAQCNFVKELVQGSLIKDTLSSSIILLSKMETEKITDKQSCKLIKQGLLQMQRIIGGKSDGNVSR